MTAVKTWTQDEIRGLLVANDAAVERALVRIFERQTTEEQRTEDTRVNNSVGFSACDARRGSYYAKWVMSGKRLTRHHLDLGRKIALKYVRQLTDIANGGVS